MKYQTDLTGSKENYSDSASQQAPSSTLIEEIFYEGRPPLTAFLARHNLLFFFLFGWNIGLVACFFQRLTWQVKLTSQRIVVIRGLIAQKEEEIPLYRVKDCFFYQSILGRIFGTGDINILSDDPTSPHLEIPIVAPREYKELLRESVQIERQRMKTFNVD
jgi:membrane protein YdbS with pleckstrin-like domain